MNADPPGVTEVRIHIPGRTEILCSSSGPLPPNDTRGMPREGGPRPSALPAGGALLIGMDSSGDVQNVCGVPNFGHEGTAIEAQAFAIMMEAAGSKIR